MILRDGSGRKIGTAACALAVALFVISCSGEGDGGDTAVETGSSGQQPAAAENTYKGNVSDVTFRTLDGDEKKLSDYGPKLMVVNYLATWNEDSKKLVPIMNEMWRKFGGNVIVLGVVVDVKSAAQAKAFGKSTDMKFELLMPGGHSGRFGTPGKLPTSYFVTKDDHFLSSFEGLVREKQYEDMIRMMRVRRM